MWMEVTPTNYHYLKAVARVVGMNTVEVIMYH